MASHIATQLIGQLRSLSVAALTVLLLEKVRQLVASLPECTDYVFSMFSYWKFTMKCVIDPVEALIVQSVAIFVRNNCD